MRNKDATAAACHHLLLTSSSRVYLDSKTAEAATGRLGTTFHSAEPSGNNYVEHNLTRMNYTFFYRRLELLPCDLFIFLYLSLHYCREKKASFKDEARRNARVLEKHDELIFKLEELTVKQAEAIKNLEVSVVSNQQVLGANDFVRRSCQEIFNFNPSLPSGMYWIDPDGQGVGDAPMVAHCDFETGLMPQ